jgi:hypothetical protein
MKKLMICLLIFTGTLLTGTCLAQKQAKQPVIAYDLYDLQQQKKLKAVNREDISPFSENGYRGIHIAGGKGHGIIWIDGPEFENGIIELDIRGRDEFQKNFIGVAFHGLNDSTFEGIYFRPFNFRNPDSVRKIHAVQYESLPVYTWFKLREERNGQFEKGIVPPPLATDWFHAKIVVQYPTVQVFVNGNKTASLTVQQLSDRKTGGFGLIGDNVTVGEFANLKVTFLKGQ